MNSFECPVCMEAVFEMKMCENNHGVCKECFSKLRKQECPTCRGRFMRNEKKRLNNKKEKLVDDIGRKIIQRRHEDAMREHRQGRGMVKVDAEMMEMFEDIKKWEEHISMVRIIEERIVAGLDRLPGVCNVLNMTATSGPTGGPIAIRNKLKNLLSIEGKIKKQSAKARMLIEKKHRERDQVSREIIEYKNKLKKMREEGIQFDLRYGYDVTTPEPARIVV